MTNQSSNLVILGSTGSIGEQALQVVEQHPDRFKVVGLAAGNNLTKLLSQVQKYEPKAVCIGENQYHQCREAVGKNIMCCADVEGMCQLASMEEADVILIAVSGAVGIKPTLAAIRAGKRVALANKETLVAAGDIVMQALEESDSCIIPVDSEHSAVFQCMEGGKHLNNIWLTASGGPFRDYSTEEMQKVSLEMALKHPNWAMGQKITIDSATMMNKGLEVIEAHHLFNHDYEQIKVVIQCESVIHSMVEFVDGSFIGHLGSPDMRIPIQYALTYPERLHSPAKTLDFYKLGAIHFEKPDPERFPAFRIAIEAGKMGGTMPAVMNAANEIAVHRFLERRISFVDIPRITEEVMNRHEQVHQPCLEEIFDADLWARNACDELVRKENNL
ncbi:MAG: 1-deoxy-D-xylulose-5-phosphate reductoisomerase [Bacillota bacterium]|nr:1-deoxy-D-xylulose-5-phosphate reductoisomerase [Bacillota bacterium]